MLVKIIVEGKTQIENVTKATIFQWDMSMEQLTKLNDFANDLVEEE